MRVSINDRLYQTLPEVDVALYEQLINLMPIITQSLPDNIRVMIKGLIRSVLALGELKYPELKEKFRPPKGVDPLVHCLQLVQGQALSKVNDVTIRLDTTENIWEPNTINTITIQLPFEGEGW